MGEVRFGLKLLREDLGLLKAEVDEVLDDLSGVRATSME